MAQAGNGRIEWAHIRFFPQHIDNSSIRLFGKRILWVFDCFSKLRQNANSGKYGLSPWAVAGQRVVPESQRRAVDSLLPARKPIANVSAHPIPSSRMVN